MSSPTHAPALGTQSDPDVRKTEVALREASGHEALDLAETEAQRLEQQRVARLEQRAKLAAQMAQLDQADREDAMLLSGSSPSSNGVDSLANGAPAPAAANGTAKDGAPAPIGPPGAGRENGAKSMPGSRRASGYGNMTFGMEKLSLSVMEGGTRKEWEEEDVDAEGARKSVRYLDINDDDPFPGIPKTEAEPKHLSAASAALDLAPLSQAPARGYSRPFDTAIKTSDWPHFPSGAARGMTSPLPGGGGLDDASAAAAAVLAASRKTSPTGAAGLADSVASLPAMPSKSVPGTPFGLGGGGGAGALGAAKGRAGTSPGLGDGFTQANRGYSNPDLARAFGAKGGSGFSLADAPRPYGADPIYAMSPSTPLAGGAGGAGAFGSNGYEYGFEDDNFGSGALYPAGMLGLKNKRAEADREFNRFNGIRLEDLAGEILALCKDQHGCRYLQKKLEEGEPAHRDMIFRETYGHFPELMIDPFGNYLCQKLLEHASEDQRSAIIDSVANDLVGISLNMHGTRAVQKMVDFLAQPRQPKQIRTLIYALSMNVVALIKDLNGNHVIQKCLNKLIPEDNQFIYNAIATNLIEVATHRHGCCVLQRSIDHASPAQRLQLVTEIIFNSLYLVQDPFGNYVIQYILDLNDARFSEPLIRTFIGNVCSLSVQKFSSNVVEKCIRVADAEIRKVLVSEVLNRSRLEKLLRDSYGNYVVQTILDYCEPAQRLVLIECIRPILPSIRNTPYGKRIQSKLQREDASFGGGGGGGGGGGYGGYGGGGGGRGGGYRGGGPQVGGYNPRHLGRPQLQHINALTEVYGTPGGAPFLPQANYMQHPHGVHAPPPHAAHHAATHAHAHAQHAAAHHAHAAHLAQPAAFHAREMHTHSGMSYHAPGPDGQPWLHLRGPAGQPAPGWAAGQAAAGAAPSPAGSAAANGHGLDPLPATAPSDPEAAAAAAAAVAESANQHYAWQDPAYAVYANGTAGHLPAM